MCGIYGCFGQVRWCVLSIGDAPVLKALANLMIDIGDEVREIDGFAFEFARSRVVEDVGQEFFQARDFTRYDARCRVDAVGRWGALKRARKAANCREWIANLVCNARRHFADYR